MYRDTIETDTGTLGGPESSGVEDDLVSEGFGSDDDLETAKNKDQDSLDDDGEEEEDLDDEVADDDFRGFGDDDDDDDRDIY